MQLSATIRQRMLQCMLRALQNVLTGDQCSMYGRLFLHVCLRHRYGAAQADMHGQPGQGGTCVVV